MNTRRNRRPHLATVIALAAATSAGMGTALVARGQPASQPPPIQHGASYLTVGLLDGIPLLLLFVTIVAVVLVAIWLGSLLGRRRGRQAQHEAEGPVGTVAASILGLLAFVLALTFGLASTRFDPRNQVLLDEAESIGTTYLRAEMLPQPQRERIRRCLREYVDLRVEAAQQSARLPALLARSHKLHDEMWAETTALVAAGHTSKIDALFIESLNRTFDLHTRRAAVALLYRIPDSVWIVLLGMSVVSMVGVGYLFGLSGSSGLPVSLALALVFSTVIAVTAALDRPKSKFLGVNQAAMLELQRTMQTPPAAQSQHSHRPDKVAKPQHADR